MRKRGIVFKLFLIKTNFIKFCLTRIEETCEVL